MRNLAQPLFCFNLASTTPIIDRIKSTCLISLLLLIVHLYLSGVWFGVATRTWTPKRHVLKSDWIALYSIVTIIWGRGARDLYHLISTEIFTLLIDKILYELQIYEKIDYKLDLNLQTVCNLMSCFTSQEEWASWKE